MDKCCKNYKYVCNSMDELYLFTYYLDVSVPDYLNWNSNTFAMRCGYGYSTSLKSSKDKFTFTIASNKYSLKCSISVFVGSGTLLYSNGLNKETNNKGNHPYFYQYELISFSSDDECFQKLKHQPSDNVLLVCRIACPTSIEKNLTSCNTPADRSHSLKMLAGALRNSPESLLKEKVVLRIGEETETVSKTVLCARSPVFAKMFQNDMKEMKDNTVTIVDIKMPILKVMTSFLYTGKLPNHDLDSLCELYYAADKYGITELRHLCVDLLFPKISVQNVVGMLKMAFSYNDERFKSCLLVFIAANVETFISSNDWKNLVNDEPQIAVEVLNFLGF